MKQHGIYRLISFVLALAMLLEPAALVLRVQQGVNRWFNQVNQPVQAEVLGNTSVYLPVLMTPPGPPDFEIISPAEGWTVSGMMYFAAQPRDPKTITSVTFSAGSTTLGTDNTAVDGYKVFFDASVYPAGSLTLTAVASGPSGQTTKSVLVNVVPNPPANGVIGSDGGILASEIGSIITIPPNALPNGTTVSVDELSQEEVTNQTGIEWEAMGVTFLGAQDIQASASFSLPYGVASADFGNRVQPGQAVVNYQIVPDADGDGVDEIVVVNTASVAPNNDVISDPVPQILLHSTVTVANLNGTVRQSLGDSVSGPPGTVLSIEATGFNPTSIMGNVAVYHSLVDNSEVQANALIMPDPDSDLGQIVLTVIPPLPVGLATLTLYNASTGYSSDALAITVEASPPLTRPAIEIIDEAITSTQGIVNEIEILAADQGISLPVDFEEINDQLTELQTYFQGISIDPTPEEEQLLNVYATMLENAMVEDYLLLDAPYRGGVGPGLTHLLEGLAAYSAVSLTVASIIGSEAPIFSFLLLTGGSAGLVVAVALIGWGIFELSWAISTAIFNGGSGTTGMGSAPPPGGNGGGNVLLAGGGFSHSRAMFGQDPGRVMVKVFSGGSAIPFTGMTDAGGYFFIPLIPEGEPFTALAIDTLTGESRISTGVGPAIGDSVFMFFDFISEAETGTPIQVGEVITGEISVPGELDIYSFSAEAGQTVFFDLQANSNLQIHWKLFDPLANTVFDNSFLNGDPGVKILTLNGTYVLIVGEGGNSPTGTYQFQMWDVPEPDVFSIAIGDVISDGNPGPGAGNIETPGVRDIYTFNASPGQVVYFDFQGGSGPGTTYWQAVDADGTIIFNTQFFINEPGVRTLTLGGTYTITVGQDFLDNTNTYQFQVWDVPEPDVFNIAIGDVISDGNPGPGAGNIETPGVRDIYTFNASPGQVVYFDFTGVSGPGTTYWQAVDADGTIIFNLQFINGDPGVRTLTLGGTYTITVGQDFLDNTNTYQFQIINQVQFDQFGFGRQSGRTGVFALSKGVPDRLKPF